MLNQHAAVKIAWVFVVLAVSLVLLAGFGETNEQAGESGGFEALPIAKNAHPRAYFFRAAEVFASDPEITYEEWVKTFGRLLGIQGKALNEEKLAMSKKVLPFFQRFKRENPDQMVLLHYNGNARDPRHDLGEYFAGHWIYFNGCRILADVPAEAGETEIRVEDAGLFKMNVGRQKDKHEDIGLCLLDENGKPDWRRSEQVELVGVDAARNTIRVKRGSFGTTPMAFPAGKAYAAAHLHEGPWGENNNLMWFYNFSTACPRDKRGRTASDVLLADLVHRFSPGGELELFDGVEFDVMWYLNRYHPDARNPEASGRGLDVDADGKIDQGRLDGKEAYGIGVVEFLRALRARFPPGKILMADGAFEGSQRGFHLLNGIESEGWPALFDPELRDWAGGLNRHFFWRDNARPPVFNYINHKFKTDRLPGGVVPMPTHRLVFAVAAFTDSALCYMAQPERSPDEFMALWDEFVMGTENRLQWLGEPVGPPARLAERSPDLLQGAGKPMSEALVKRLRGDGVEFSVEGGALKIVSRDPAAAETRFTLSGVPCNGPDLYLAFDARADVMRGYPREVARMIHARLAGANERPFWTFANQTDFHSAFYFPKVTAQTVEVEFRIEGAEPLYLANLSVHAHPDAIYREFEHGAVFANPGFGPYTFDLAKLLPGRSYRRLQGTEKQDPKTNDGSAAGVTLQLPARDALFLVKE